MAVLINSRVKQARKKMRAILDIARWSDGTDLSQRTLIARYTAAIAVNFTDWMGKTLPWVRHEFAEYILKDNLRCEATQDHAGMLLNFAKQAGALPDDTSFAIVAAEVTKIRELFTNPTSAGLTGVALMTALENTSIEFIPELQKIGKHLRVSDLCYTQAHGEADVKHSEAFLKALESEMSMGYSEPAKCIDNAFTCTNALLAKIFQR